ncbi:hypothetical protein J6590_074291 [Homalodisca vitripennis]|nr:hypothetical protein J6590_074291 [Homalodisca vitripennis]
MGQKEFRTQVPLALMQLGKNDTPERGRPFNIPQPEEKRPKKSAAVRPPHIVTKDKTDHSPVWEKKRNRDFALIERCKTTATFQVPQHVWTMIEIARPSKPFHVVVMEQDDFIDLSPAEQQLNKNSKLTKVSQGRWIKIRSDDPSQIRLRKNPQSSRDMDNRCHPKNTPRSPSTST